ncbi:MAG: hypothetical protein BGO44_16860 [Legionella sp. 39-23]|nr:MAG: hypothetical protein BGO44_16860 [Legionella sp. 39-23]
MYGSYSLDILGYLLLLTVRGTRRGRLLIRSDRHHLPVWGMGELSSWQEFFTQVVSAIFLSN